MAKRAKQLAAGGVEVAIPETTSRMRVSFAGIQRDRLMAWTRKKRAEWKMRFDAAAITDDNRNYWTNADNLSARAANSKAVRQTLRKRSRYEVRNNSYALGIVNTLANHTIGTGPRPQVLGISKESAKFVAKQFRLWANEIQLARKLRTLRAEKCTNGEGFGILTTNPGLQTEVMLDLMTVEADRIADTEVASDPRNIDGILLDAFGNPAEYRVLKYHPGDDVLVSPLIGKDSYDTIPVRRMCHWFSQNRSGQYRGVPDITPALPLFAQLRRYTLAVIAAAETAADFAAVLESEAPANGDDSQYQGGDFETLDIEKRMLMNLPAGHKLNQLKAEQPTTTYDSFVKAIIREISRCVNMPYAIAAGDSGDASFSSSQNDQRVYVRSIEIDQDDCETIVLAKLFREWIREASLVPNYLPSDVRGVPECAWHWDSINLGDPLKIANARGKALQFGFGNIARYYAEDGLDCEEEQTAHAEALGMSLDEYRAALRVKLLAAVSNAAVEQQPFGGDEPEPARQKASE